MALVLTIPKRDSWFMVYNYVMHQSLGCILMQHGKEMSYALSSWGSMI